MFIPIVCKSAKYLAWISLSQPLHQHVPYYKRTLRTSLSQSISAAQTYAAYRSLHLREFFKFLNTMLSKHRIQNLVELPCWRRNPAGRIEGKVAVRKVRYNAKSLLRNVAVLLEQILQGLKSVCRESSGRFIHKCVHRLY
jgi:hypothetical protein